jgi:hypothetical protein
VCLMRTIAACDLRLAWRTLLVTLTCRYGTVVPQTAKIGCPQHTADIRLGRASATFNQIEEQP